MSETTIQNTTVLIAEMPCEQGDPTMFDPTPTPHIKKQIKERVGSTFSDRQIDALKAIIGVLEEGVPHTNKSGTFLLMPQNRKQKILERQTVLTIFHKKLFRLEFSEMILKTVIGPELNHILFWNQTIPIETAQHIKVPPRRSRATKLQNLISKTEKRAAQNAKKYGALLN